MSKLRETTLLLMVTAAATSLIACSNASAMAAKQKAEAGTSATTVVAPGDETSGSYTEATAVGAAAIMTAVSAGDYEQGRTLGHTNGGNAVNRLRIATVETKGCRAVGDLQNALLAVSRTIRAPQGPNGNDQLVRGFYRGYVDAIREGIRDARAGCDVQAHDDGAFAGELYGNVLCRATTINVEVATQLELTPLYDGWSGGNSEVIEQCATKAAIVIESCSTAGNLSEVDLGQILINIQTGCSDI